MSYYYDFEGYARPKKTIPQNVPYDTWAPQMWSQFDTLGNNFTSSQDFASQVHSLINQIPCPECKSDGLSYVKTNPPENVNSKSAAVGWVKAYHSHVDQVAKKKSGWGFYQGAGGAGGGPGEPGQPGEGGGRGGRGGRGGVESNNIDISQFIDTAGKTDNSGDRIKGPGGISGSHSGGSINTSGGGQRIQGPGGISGSHSGGNIDTSGGGQRISGPGRISGGSGNFPQSGFSRDSRDPWYSTMWAELHEYANDYNPLTFADDVRNQIEEIPAENERCYINSQEFMRKYPPEYVGNRQHAMYWMCRFHNHASLDAGNGLVDCELDAEGYGYVSGHDDYARDFFYGGGGGSRGGGGGQGGGRGGGGRHGGKGGRRGGRGGHGHGGGGSRGGGGMDQMRGGGGGPGFQPGGYATKTIRLRESPAQAKIDMRSQKGAETCQCVGGTFTGVGCPYIGQSCYRTKVGNKLDKSKELWQSTIQYPIGGHHSSCPPGQILTPQGACIKPESWKDIEERTRGTERTQRISIA